MCAGDCDDADPVTYPGAAFNESTTACMTDFDGDGYGEDLERQIQEAVAMSSI